MSLKSEGNRLARAEQRGAARAPTMLCPHCQSSTYARSSEGITPLYREIRYACADVECGHTFLASLSVIHTISPSAKPNPDIILPVWQRGASAKPANDNQEALTPSPAANDPLHVETG